MNSVQVLKIFQTEILIEQYSSPAWPQEAYTALHSLCPTVWEGGHYTGPASPPPPTHPVQGPPPQWESHSMGTPIPVNRQTPVITLPSASSRMQSFLLRDHKRHTDRDVIVLEPYCMVGMGLLYGAPFMGPLWTVNYKNIAFGMRSVINWNLDAMYFSGTKPPQPFNVKLTQVVDATTVNVSWKINDGHSGDKMVSAIKNFTSFEHIQAKSCYKMKLLEFF